MKSYSLQRQQNMNNSFSSPDKRMSYQTTQSTLKKEQVQSYFYQQSYLKEESQKWEIIKLLKFINSTLIKNITNHDLNCSLTKFIIGLKNNQDELSLLLAKFVDLIKQIINNHHLNQQQEYEQEKAQLAIKLQLLEQEQQQNQLKYEQQIRLLEQQKNLNNLRNELDNLKDKKENNTLTNVDKDKLKDQIKEMQEKITNLSEKEKKLISLVKAVKGRGIDVETIYKQMSIISAKSSALNHEDTSNSFIESKHSNYGDISQLDNSGCIIKRNTQYLID